MLMIPKAWGQTQSLYRDEHLEVVKITVHRDGHSSRHFHRDKVNIFLVTHGKLLVTEFGHDGPVEHTLSPGCGMCTIGPGVIHQFRAIEEGTAAYELYLAANGQSVDPFDIVRLSTGGVGLTDDGASCAEMHAADPNASAAVGLTWGHVCQLRPIWLNLGGKGDCHPQPRYRGYVSVDRRRKQGWSVQHNLRHPMPLPDASVARILSEHFLEHVSWRHAKRILCDCYRVLEPGGFLRLALPDCRHPKMRESLAAGRDLVNSSHRLIFTREILMRLLRRTPFRRSIFYHYWDEQERFVRKPIDYGGGWVKRTPDHDRRNRCHDSEYGDLAVTSIVVDLFRD